MIKPDIQNIQDTFLSEKNNFLTLKETAKIYGYTQHHLGLLCRQGKLKNKRTGKNWFTTKEWIDEYLLGLQEYYKNGDFHYTNSAAKIKIEAQKAEVEKKEEAPILVEPRRPFLRPGFKFALGLSIILLIFSFFRNNDIKLSPPRYFNGDEIVSSLGINFSSVWKEVRSEFESLGNQIKSYAQGLGRKIKLAFYAKYFGKEERQKISEAEPGDFEEPKVRDGLVVIPGAKDEDRIKTIKESFSDEIIVKPDDEIGDSGIIQPIFKKIKGEEYIYVMVPAKKTNLPAQAGVEEKNNEVDKINN